MSLISPGSAGGAIDYGFGQDLLDVLARGPDLIELIPGGPGCRCARTWTSMAWRSSTRREVWTRVDTTADEAESRWIADRWPGRAVRLHHGGLRQHLRLTGRDPALVDLGVEVAIRRIVTLLTEDNSFDPDANRAVLGRSLAALRAGTIQPDP